MLMPYRSLADPEVQAEGSIDPLGLATLADHLSDWILPGMTARMWRPRFLTAMAAASVIVDPFEDDVGKDGITPPWLVLEWYYVEAIASHGALNGEGLHRIPGIDKARRAVREKVPMNADRYLKAPKVFGFHGVYKRLVRHLDIVDDNLRLGENGYRLLRIWEKEEALSGFSDPDQVPGDAARILRILREAIRDALRTGQTERQGTWVGATFFVDHLLPQKIGHQEAEFIWQGLLESAAEPRGEIFRFMREPETRRQFEQDGNERKAFAKMQARVSSELRRRIEAIEAYERVCRPLQEAWDHLRRLATINRPSAVRERDMASDPRVRALALEFPDTITRAREVLADSPISSGFEELVRTFGEVRMGGDFFHTLWRHHEAVQRGKPPEGKRPWFEATGDGSLVVRPLYRLEEVPPQERFVHPYRLSAVTSFVKDLWGEA